MSTRVLVTGAQGLVGRYLARAALDAGHTVVGCGRSLEHDDFGHSLDVTGVPGGRRAPLPSELTAVPGHPRYRYDRVDLASGAVADAVRAAAPDLVVHAASSLRGTSTGDLVANNLMATATLLEALPAGQRVLLVSSGSVYGRCEPAELPLTEATPCRPADRYGVTKRAAEDLARVIARERGLDLVVARVFNVVGPGLQTRHLPSAVAARLAAIAHGLVEPELRLGTLHATRDFVDVHDVARALLAVGLTGAGCYNVASGVETPVADVVEDLLAAAGLEVRRTFAEEPERPVSGQLAHGIDRAVADVARLADLGAGPAVPLATSLRELYDYSVWAFGSAASSEASSR